MFGQSLTTTPRITQEDEGQAPGRHAHHPYRFALPCLSILGTGKTMPARGVTGLYAFFLRLEIGQLSPRFGATSLLNYTENLEHKGNHSVETAPRNCSFLSLVVVARLLRQDDVSLPGNPQPNMPFPPMHVCRQDTPLAHPCYLRIALYDLT